MFVLCGLCFPFYDLSVLLSVVGRVVLLQFVFDCLVVVLFYCLLC